MKVGECGAPEREGGVHLPACRGVGSEREGDVYGGGGGEGAYLPAYRVQRASQSFDESSSYEGDRPLSVSTLSQS